MITLVPLCTMTMTIDRAVNAGPAPTGQRMIRANGQVVGASGLESRPLGDGASARPH